MDTLSSHLLGEYRGCDRALLNDPTRLERLLRDAAEAAGATVVGVLFHRYSPHGVSGVVLVAESHMSIHTWPEAGYAAVDYFTCGDCTPRASHPVMMDGLGAESGELMVVQRGRDVPGESMVVAEHLVDPRGT